MTQICNILIWNRKFSCAMKVAWSWCSKRSSKRSVLSSVMACLTARLAFAPKKKVQDPTCLTTYNHHFSGMPRRCSYKHGVKDLTRPSIRISYLCSHIDSPIAVGSIQHTASCLGSGETYHFSMFKDWKTCFCIEYIPIYYIHTNWQYIYICNNSYLDTKIYAKIY